MSTLVYLHTLLFYTFVDATIMHITHIYNVCFINTCCLIKIKLNDYRLKPVGLIATESRGFD